MSKKPRTEILMVGHFARDRIVVDGRSQTQSGGGVYFGSVALRRLGVGASVVTRLHPNDFSYLDELREAGVEVFASEAAETSGIENVYDSADMERRVCRPIGFAGPFRAEEIPDMEAKVVVAASIMAGEIDLSLLQSLARRGPVALDAQGFVRVRAGDDLVYQPWREMEVGLAEVTYLKVDQAEAELLTGQTDLELAARQLARYGPSEIVLTQSLGVTVLAEGRIHRAPFRSRSLEGRTGRGDTCFATYLGCRLSSPPDVATRWAAAVTSLKQEKPGPWRGSLEDVQAMLLEQDSEEIHGKLPG